MTDESNASTEPRQDAERRNAGPKRTKRDVHGWLIFDKPVGMTSTRAVSVAKRLYSAKRAGHAGTLDPLASGLLPIALGEATKTVPYVMDGRKTYQFTVRWGEERDTDDAEGKVVASSEQRPTADAVQALLPRFTGAIEQVPPQFSAIKVAGERAYDLARDGEIVELAARTVDIHHLDIVESPDADHTVLAAECGKGTYVRALARDLGRILGCYGHVSALRRTGVGLFHETAAITLDRLQDAAPEDGDSGGNLASLMTLLQPVAAGLQALPSVTVSRSDAARLARGQGVIMRGRDAPIMQGAVAVFTHGALIALGEIEQGALNPRRIFNLNGANATAESGIVPAAS